MTRYLYIHIPFCRSICTYCDFVRIKNLNPQVHKNYIDMILSKLSKEAIYGQFKTIYIGGGTPNALSNENLFYLLNNLKKYLDLKSDYEFSIELNPELCTKDQIKILSDCLINRISLGVQTTNNNINILLHRYSTINDANNAIKWLNELNITNISCDFMYNLPLLKMKDLDNAFDFICNQNINHVSFYALELKENSILTKKHYKLNTNIEQIQYEYINRKMYELGFERYEVASYCKNHMYSKHNLAYWLNKDWMAIGSGAYGFENGIYYSYKPEFDKLIRVEEKYDFKSLYQHLLIMGLRSKFGLDLNISRNKEAYDYFYDQIKDDVYINKNNHLIIKNIDFLDDCLIKLF